MQFKQFQINQKKFPDFDEIRAHGLWVNAAVLYQLSYEDPYIGSRPFIEFILTRERNAETQNENDVNCGNTKSNISLDLHQRCEMAGYLTERLLRIPKEGL